MTAVLSRARPSTSTVEWSSTEVHGLADVRLWRVALLAWEEDRADRFLSLEVHWVPRQ